MDDAPPPAGRDPADPSTWRFVSEVVRVSAGRRDPDDPIGGRREIVTAATDFGHADDPPLLLGMPPRRAAAWWAGVLGPIHLARVAAIRYPIETPAFLAGEPPPWGGGPARPGRRLRPPAAGDARGPLGYGAGVPRGARPPGARPMTDDRTKAALARLRAERRVLAQAKKAILAEIRAVRVRHRPSAQVAAGWRHGPAQRAAFEEAMAADRAGLAAALAPHEEHLAEVARAIDRTEAAIRGITERAGGEPGRG